MGSGGGMGKALAPNGSWMSPSSTSSALSPLKLSGSGLKSASLAGPGIGSGIGSGSSLALPTTPEKGARARSTTPQSNSARTT
eukprot:CAMPEP_0175061816 /NCGR_PEP_ID=MMETSP0052_2-20121109/13801_1 /TAXON_ID=51329 ORGANISM="Polytomella parva, Strain SAG 63-3" /NCGR_SAMPLE_ID=MMETSP0052_2 /ASSEMBLY_ACC=CAM_ASM_000194 /LENGTH=82 /DNA_ID=CAMNT_0016327725 /DNA_START=6 /DNA_END=250 /DNA_ORIENTATION=-